MKLELIMGTITYRLSDDTGYPILSFSHTFHSRTPWSWCGCAFATFEGMKEVILMQYALVAKAEAQAFLPPSDILLYQQYAEAISKMAEPIFSNKEA